MSLIQKHYVNFNIYQGFYFDIIARKSIDQTVLDIKISIFLLYFRNSAKKFLQIAFIGLYIKLRDAKYQK